MTVEQRLSSLEQFQSDVEGWHVPGKLNKAGDAILTLQGAVTALTAQNHTLLEAVAARDSTIAALTARVAAIEAQLGDPP